MILASFERLDLTVILTAETLLNGRFAVYAAGESRSTMISLACFNACARSLACSPPRQKKRRISL